MEGLTKVSGVHSLMSLSNFYLKLSNFGSFLDQSDIKALVYLKPRNFAVCGKVLEDGNGAIRFYVDGMFTTFLLNLLTPRSLTIEREFFDFSGAADFCFRELISRNLNVLALGGNSKQAESFRIVMQNRYPELGLEVVDGFRSLDELVEFAGESSADICLVGLGVGKQEIFCERIGKKSVTCGAFISQTGDSLVNQGSFYPRWAIRYNLRFVYRCFESPKHGLVALGCSIKFVLWILTKMVRNDI